MGLAVLLIYHLGDPRPTVIMKYKMNALCAIATQFVTRFHSILPLSDVFCSIWMNIHKFYFKCTEIYSTKGRSPEINHTTATSLIIGQNKLINASVMAEHITYQGYGVRGHIFIYLLNKYNALN